MLLPQTEADADPTKIKGLRRIPPGFTRGLNLGGETDDFDDIALNADGSSVAAQVVEVRCPYFIHRFAATDIA